MPRTHPLARLGLALLVSVLAGLLVAALAFPLVGAPALAAKSTAEDFLELPAELTSEDPAAITRILDADGHLIATLYLENRVPVPLTVVPKHVQQAVLAIEDARFYEHNGVDVKGTARAALRTTAGDVQGGSTITQQYVKNALLISARDEAGQAAATEQTISRKLKEARYALALEKQLSKDQILERYLNVAYFGNGAYGIAAAAKYYWGKPVQDLTIAQGAMLAGMVQNPSRFDPTDAEKAPGVKVRRNLVMRRMADLGFISDLTYRQGSELPLALNITRTGDSCDSPKVVAPFFCDYVRRELEDTEVGAALGDSKQARQNRLLGGGLIIRTSLDLKVQEAADRAALERVPADDPSGARVAVDVVEPGTGHIKALSVNQPYGEGEGQTKVNYTVGGNFGFQAGSTFKTFVLADALRQGITPSRTYFSPAEYESDVFENCDGNRCEPYRMVNSAESENGTFDMRSATALSVNTYFVQLMEDTGVDGPAQLAEALGLRRVKDEQGQSNVPLGRFGSFVLGSNEVSPLAMAGAYAAFAAGGEYCRPQAVLSITDRAGRPVEVPEPECKQVVEPDVASQVNELLRGVVTGPLPKTGSTAAIGRPVAGKTGTTNSSRAAWFVGYTPQLATSVWVGMPSRETGAPQPMRRVRIGGRYYPQVYGGTIPAAVFRETMQAALDGEPVVDFDEVALQQREPAEGEGVVPDLRGQTVEEAFATLRAAGFEPVDAGRSDADWVPVGTVAFSSPGRGDAAPAGSTVQVFTANGRPRD